MQNRGYQAPSQHLQLGTVWSAAGGSGGSLGMHRAWGWALSHCSPSMAWSRHPALGKTRFVRELGTQRGFLRQEEDSLQEMSQILLQVSLGHVTAAVLAMPIGRGGL